MQKLSVMLTDVAPLLLVSSPVAGQNTTSGDLDPNTAATMSADDDENEFPWGLLGLIGLAGLLGRKRNDHRQDSNLRN